MLTNEPYCKVLPFDLKISKLKLLLKQRHLHLGRPWCKLKHFKVNNPFKEYP